MENGAAASLVDHQQELGTAACPVPRPGPSTGHAWSSWVLFLCQHCPAAPSSQDAFVTAMISPDLATCVSPQPCLQDVSRCLPHGKNREIIITSGPTAPWAQAAQQGARPLGQCPSFSWVHPWLPCRQGWAGVSLHPARQKTGLAWLWSLAAKIRATDVYSPDPM